ncbi:hypothetical protein C8024_12280 [Sphingopyxis sp. BSNA05]|uniref:hypothetical protein n=1 Tax=Sphingopyxis sp. BSNA05 TaxID=1236614 RepID=UPI0015636A5E|nr:hypothetical protein [Sphingopyxis sp. BSNA05]NRD90069.1 hypothetical protein [Sphingopyxis sp. BSNA05]
MQLKLDDGTMVSIVGPASYSIGSNGQLSMTSGSFTASVPKGGNPVPILAGNGSQISLRSGSSASGQIAADGSFSGFALSGSMQVSSNGRSRSFSAGSAFRASAGSGPSATVSAGVQPNRSGGQTAFQQVQQAQRTAAQYLANASQTSPSSLGYAGVSQTQNFTPGTLQSATTIPQLQALVQAQTGAIDPALAVQIMLDILAASANGNLGTYSGLTPTQIQAFLFNLQTYGVPSSISQFQLEEFLRALGAAGYTVGGISGSGPSFGSLADLLALVSSGGTIPPGDPTVQALIDLLFANAFPPGIDPDELARLFRLAGYSVPPQFGGNTGGGTPTPTPTPTPPPVLAASDGVRPDDSQANINLAFAKITETGQASPVTLMFDAGEFVGYRLSSGFEIRFNERDEVEKGGDQGIIGWSRLAGGTKILGALRGPNSGDHFIFGLPLVNAPSGGLLNYDLIGYTSPTLRDDSVAPGVFNGKFSVNFGTAQILAGLEARVSIAGSLYEISSAGGVLAPSISVLSDGRFNGTIDLEDGLGIACSVGDCRFIYNGFLAGDGASHAGFAYTIRDDALNVTKWIDGSAAFAKGGNSGGTPNPITKTFRGEKIDDGFAQPVAGNFASAIDVSTNFLTRGEQPADEGRAFRITGYTDGDPSNKSALSEVRVKAGVGDAFRSIGTAKNVENGALGDVLGWTRWADGEFSNIKGGKRILEGNESIHYIFGENVTGTLPTGRAEYAVGGGTRPTRFDGMGEPGTFEGEIAIDFATLKMGWDTIIGMGNDRFNFLSAGGLDDLSISVINAGNGVYNFSGEGTVLSELGRCEGCTGSASGFLSGKDGRYVGFSYEIGTADYGAIHGVAGFARADQEGEPVEVTRNEQIINGLGNRMQTVGFSDGRLSEYRGLANTSGKRGTAAIVDFGTAADGVINWSRWADGTATLSTINGARDYDYPENGGVHFVYGSPATDLPTGGTIIYDLVGSTSPTLRDGSQSPGTFDGQLAIAFGATPKVGLEFDVGIGGSSYGIATTGGVAGAATDGLVIYTDTSTGFTYHSFASFNVPVTGDGPVCASGCSATIDGFLAGETASHVGVNYTFGSSASGLIVEGAAAFGKSGSAATASNMAGSDWSTWTGANSRIPADLGNASRIGIGPRSQGRPGSALNPGDGIAAIRERLGPNFPSTSCRRHRVRPTLSPPPERRPDPVLPAATESNSVCHVSNTICNWQTDRIPASFCWQLEQGEWKL